MASCGDHAPPGVAVNPLRPVATIVRIRFQLEIIEKAREALRTLPKPIRQNIGRRIEALRNDLQGDVTKPQGQKQRCRLRVGARRILFILAGETITVYGVRDRKDAYD